MKELQDIIRGLQKIEAKGEACAIATVVAVSGSTYRRPGARMLVSVTGQTIGSVSGGCLEEDICQKAQEVIKSQKPLLLQYDTTCEDDILWGSGIGCCGITQILIDSPQRKGSDIFLLRMDELFKKKKGLILATVFQESEKKQGEKSGSLLYSDDKIILNTINNKSLLKKVLLEGKKTVSLGIKNPKHYTIKNPEGTILIEFLPPPISVLFFGGGHDVYPLIAFSKMLGWHVTVVEHRKLWAKKNKFPQADEVIFWDKGPQPASIDMDHASACVIKTHHYLTDKKILKKVLFSSSPYIGFLGPKERAGKIIDELCSEGIRLSEQQQNRLYNPIGLDIGAEVAEEIGLSIITEILAVISNRQGGLLRERKNRIHTIIDSTQSPL